jgi:hypothetical protein
VEDDQLIDQDVICHQRGLKEIITEELDARSTRAISQADGVSEL